MLMFFYRPEDSEIEVENMKEGVGKLDVFPSIWGHWAGGPGDSKDDVKCEWNSALCLQRYSEPSSSRVLPTRLFSSSIPKLYLKSHADSSKGLDEKLREIGL